MNVVNPLHNERSIIIEKSTNNYNNYIFFNAIKYLSMIFWSPLALPEKQRIKSGITDHCYPSEKSFSLLFKVRDYNFPLEGIRPC